MSCKRVSLTEALALAKIPNFIYICSHPSSSKIVLEPMRTANCACGFLRKHCYELSFRLSNFNITIHETCRKIRQTQKPLQASVAIIYLARAGVQRFVYKVLKSLEFLICTFYHSVLMILLVHDQKSKLETTLVISNKRLNWHSLRLVFFGIHICLFVLSRQITHSFVVCCIFV